MRFVPLFILALLVSLSSVADAQRYYGGGPGDYYNSSYRPLTVEESRMNGMSNLARSTSRANMNNAAAAQGWQEARSMDLDNRMKQTNTYFEMRETNKAYRFKSPDEQEAQRQRNNAKRLFRYGQEGQPLRPTPEQLDPVTGEIFWPFILTAPEYTAYRERIGAMFSARAKMHNHLNYQQVSKVVEVTGDMLGELKTHIRDLPTTDYMNSKKFIEALAYEVRNPTS